MKAFRAVVGLVSLGLALGVSFACNSGMLRNTRWTLVALNGRKAPEGITLHLGDWRFTGFAGCNDIEGEYKAQGDRSISIPEVSRTLRDCGAEVMEWEQAYLEALTQATGYRLSDDQLTFENTAGETILLFLRLG